MPDIFTDMQARIGCRDISQLMNYKRAVWFELRRMCLSEYDPAQLEDFARYVFGVRYSLLEEVMRRVEKENQKSV